MDSGVRCIVGFALRGSPPMLMSAADYRESLRSYHPTVYVDGKKVESVADEPSLAPGINGIAVTYDFALQESSQALMRTTAPGFEGPVNRMIAIPRSTEGERSLAKSIIATRLPLRRAQSLQETYAHAPVGIRVRSSGRESGGGMEPTPAAGLRTAARICQSR